MMRAAKGSTRRAHGTLAPDDREAAPPELAEAIAYHLRLAQEASFQAFRGRVGHLDLQPGRYAILSIIGNSAGLTPTELSRASGRDKSTLTPALKDLARRGLVERHRQDADERSYTVHLTAAGQELLETLRMHAKAHDRLLEQIVGSEAREAFLEVLRRLTTELSIHRK